MMLHSMIELVSIFLALAINWKSLVVDSACAPKETPCSRFPIGSVSYQCCSLMNANPIALETTCHSSECIGLFSCFLLVIFGILHPNSSSSQLCGLCDGVIPIVQALAINNQTQNFDIAAPYFCNQFKIIDPVTCLGAIEQYKLSFFSVIRDTTLSTTEFCNIGLDCGPVLNPVLNWNITLPNVPKPDPFVPKQPKFDPKSNIAQEKRVLHYTYFCLQSHIDFEYQPGSVADCTQSLCCRKSSQPAYSTSGASGAGFWGDYRNCDMPFWTVENMLEHIANNEEFDFVYWTGDIPAHNVWNQKRSEQIYGLRYLTDLFIKYFPNKVVYSTLGNHEAAPSDLFPPPFVKEDNINWLYTAIAKNWTALGLPDELSQNISIGGFYTVPVRPGLRVVSLNTNYCYRQNIWLFINSTDTLGQLTWLANVLQQSENIGEKVHIIGHIHPKECMSSWSLNYYRIVNRYENTIASQFFGHSHVDSFTLFYDLNDLTRPISMAYMAPSVTTWYYLNPTYRIYTVDGSYSGSTFQVLNHDTMYLNITEANLLNQTKWQLEYNTMEAFGMNTSFPQDWNNLIEQCLSDPNGLLFEKLYKYFHQSYDNPPACDLNCRMNFLCTFKQSRSDKFIQC